jgi:hypothetical protein
MLACDNVILFRNNDVFVQATCLNKINLIIKFNRILDWIGTCLIRKKNKLFKFQIDNCLKYNLLFVNFDSFKTQLIVNFDSFKTQFK